MKSKLKYLGKVQFILLSFLFSAHPALSEGHSTYVRATDQWFEPYYEISEPKLELFVRGILSTLVGLRDETRDETQPVRTTLIFMSQTDAIIDGYVNREIFSERFSEEQILSMISKPSLSDECYVASKITVESYEFVLGINQAKNGSIDSDRHCFLVALARHEGMDLQNLENTSVNELLVKIFTLYLENRSNEQP